MIAGDLLAFIGLDRLKSMKSVSSESTNTIGESGADLESDGSMKKILMTLVMVLLAPLAFAESYRDLDTAMSSLARGFERGESASIVSGVGDQVMLQFPGLMDEDGFFGRDQASYLLDDLFRKVNPSGFEVISARKVSAQGQYHVTANWTISVGNSAEIRELWVTLQSREDRWSIASIRSSGRK